jgi:hypothetical protein
MAEVKKASGHNLQALDVDSGQPRMHVQVQLVWQPQLSSCRFISKARHKPTTPAEELKTSQFTDKFTIHLW